MLGVRRQAVGALGALALAAPVLAGCGVEATIVPGSGGETELLGERPGRLTCEDWRAGTEAQRRGTVQQLTMLAGANANPEDLGPNRVLTADRAYEALDGTCSTEIARGFLLYEIYNRGAAFWPGTVGQ